MLEGASLDPRRQTILQIPYEDTHFPNFSWASAMCQVLCWELETAVELDNSFPCLKEEASTDLGTVTCTGE